MKISELIEKLQEFKDEYGDLEVYFSNDIFLIQKVIIEKDSLGKFVLLK